MVLLTKTSFQAVLDGAKWLCIDFETDGLHPITNKIVGMSILSNKGGGYIPLAPYRKEENAVPWDGENPDEIGAMLGSHLQFNTIPVIGHNIKFDLHCLTRLTGGILPTNIVDTQVGMWLLAEENELGLKGTLNGLFDADFADYGELINKTTAFLHEEIRGAREAYVLLAPPRKKGVWGKQSVESIPMRKAQSSDVPIEWIAPYAYRDVVGTAFLWFRVVRPLLQKEELLAYFYSYEMPFLRVLFDMEQRGIRVDTEGLKEMERSLSHSLLSIQQEADSVAGKHVNLSSILELREMLFDTMGYIPSGRLTDKGAHSLDEKALKQLLLSYPDAPIFQILQKYRETKKRLSDYAIGLQEAAIEGRIHTTYNQTGTVTGRLSSSSPNLQNQEKGGQVRKVFIASPGMAIVKVDYSQAELRILADRTEDPVLLDVYGTGKDIHAETQHRLNLPDRRMAKVVNFLIVYGGGASTYYENLFFNYGVRNYSVEKCSEDIKNFYAVYKAINPWKKKAIDTGKRNGFVKSRFGRRRHLPLLNATDMVGRSYAERQCVNTLIQGDVADIVKAAMILAAPIAREYGGHLLLQVHDELVFEIPRSEAENFAFDIKGEMENVVGLLVPVVVDVAMGDNWGECS